MPKSNTTEMMVRARRALWVVVGMLCLSLLLVVLGIYTTTRTESLSITGYSSGVVLAFGSFLGVLGLCLEENRKQLRKDIGFTDINGGLPLWVMNVHSKFHGNLAFTFQDMVVAAIVFLSLGIITSSLCLVIDGVFIVFNMDVRPLKAGRCQFYTSGSSYIYENYYASVPCRNLKESCSMTVRSGTCYCCDLYDCANGGYLNNYYEFVGVQSCHDVLTLYVLICVLNCLNLVAFFMGIVTTAVLGSIKDLKSSSQWTQSSEDGVSSPTAPLLMDASTHTVHQLHSRGSMYFSPAAGTGSCQSDSSSESPPHTQPNPPPFAPLYNLLSYKAP